MRGKILIIDDDQDLNELLRQYLAKFGFDVLSAPHPTQGLELLRRHAPDLVVLDVMLPEKNGFDVCREIRSHSTLPIIMLTARGDLSDRIVGLELGADDYLPKPYEPRELVARIQSVLRRTQAFNQNPGPTRRWKSQELQLDLNRASATLDGQALDLTTTEFGILCLLMENRGVTLSRDQISEKMRGVEWNNLDRTVDVLISRIRNKLKDDPRHPRFLKTFWGTGYRFVGEVTYEAQ